MFLYLVVFPRSFLRELWNRWWMFPFPVVLPLVAHTRSSFLVPELPRWKPCRGKIKGFFALFPGPKKVRRLPPSRLGNWCDTPARSRQRLLGGHKLLDQPCWRVLATVLRPGVRPVLLLPGRGLCLPVASAVGGIAVLVLGLFGVKGLAFLGSLLSAPAFSGAG